MKCKVTKKAVRANYYKIISIGYCDLQYLLKYVEPFGYSAGAYGWACDYYDIDGVLIATGYQPLSDSNVKWNYELVQVYEDRARDIVRSLTTYGEQKKLLVELLKDFVKEVTKCERN